VASQEHANESRRTTRSQRRLGSTSISPVGSPKRHGTPDQRQVLESLREASASVSHSRSPERHAPTVETGPSTATPSPPVQHTISTTSTPAPPTFDHSVANGDTPYDHRSAPFMYPPLPRFGSQTNRGSSVLSSPQDADSLDNESTISWVLERDLHGDEVQRIRPNRYRRQEPHGRNITAPPRRLSGLTFLNDTIHEQPDPPSPPVSSAPAKTVISTTTIRDIPDHDSTIDDASAGDSTTFPAVTDHFAPFTTGLSRIRFYWSLIFAVLVAASAFGIYCFSDQLAAATHALTSSLPFGHRPPYATLNASDVRIIVSLSNEVEKLGSRLSSMSNDVDVLKSDWREGVDQPTPVRPVEPQVTDRINFLSLGMRTAVDLSLTSPSIGRRRTLVRRLYGYVAGQQLRHPNPPDTALKPWDGVGDCWCSAPSNAGLAQIAILLGQRAVLEEVVVEHIPKQASPNPDVAPREMELWAQFRPQHHDPATLGTIVPESSIPPPAPSGSSFFDRFFSPSKPSPNYSSPPSAATSSSPLSLSSLYDTILETLHRAYPSEPETAYSNDALLGPSFFRVGKWQYDRDGDVAQRFRLDAVVDLPALRVDKVVFRVKSNWGAPHTCLYRLKLYGHV
jgi:hypothetical protein